MKATDGSEIKLLIVDDDESIRRLLYLSFEEDFIVFEAQNGVEAFEKALESSPDIIISDIMMPRLDGYGLYRKIKSRPETSSIPFVFLTAKKDVDELVVGLEMGADDYITKPFSIKELKAKIKSIVRKAREVHVAGRLDGDLREVDLVEVVQLIEMGKKTGTLLLETGYEKGKIYFHQGCPRYAQTGNWLGTEAFFAMFSWKRGKFQLVQNPVEIVPNMEACRGQELVMEGVRLMDEMEEAATKLPHKDARLVASEAEPLCTGEMREVIKAFRTSATVPEALNRLKMPPFRVIPLVAKGIKDSLLKEGISRKERLEFLRVLKDVIRDL